MAPIAPESVYTKTAKGILEVKNKPVKVPRELTLVLLAIDGKSSIGELQTRSGMTVPQFHHAIGTLVSDGYIKIVSAPARETAAAHDDEVDFIPQQALTALNMEAASHALAAAEAAKRAQAESRAALDARMRVESEARARALAETRAEAESQAQTAAEEAARNAMSERAEAELQARDAADAQARAQAEARARAAAAAAVRAEAEARVRAEGFARAKAEAEDKRIAQEEALREVEARARSEEQAQARAAAEERARIALEAQMQALQSVRTTAEGDAEAARARVRELEQEAAEARAAARESAEAEGRADEVAEPEMDIADRVRQLNARVSAERRAREEAARKPRMLDERERNAGHESGRAWPSLQLADTTAPAAVNLLDIAIEPPQEPERVPEAAPQATEDGDFPVVDLERAEPPPRTPEHEPTALERAMAQIARAKAENQSSAAPPIEAAPDAPAPEPPADTSAEAATSADAAPAEKLVPTLDDDEPLQERLNVDRAAHDIMAEEAEARRKAETAQFTRDAIDARRRRADEEARKAKLARNREQRKKALAAAGIALVVVPLAGVLWLQFSALDGYIPEAQRALEKRFNQPVSIGELRYPLLPRPRLILENVSIGEGSLTAKRVEAPVLPLAVLAGVSSFATVEVDGAEIDQRALAAIPAWTGGRTAGSIQTERLRVRELQVKLANATLEPVDGEIEFAPNGTVRRASFVGEKMKLLLTPQADGARVELTATGWRIPYGPPFEWSHFQLRGLIDHTQVAAAEFTGRVGGGGVEGALNARWADGIEIRGDFSAAGVRLQELARALGSEFSATGMLKATGRFVMQAPEWSGLAAGSRLEAAFTGSRGELTNIDLMRAVQSPTPGAMRGGRTPFESFSGTLQMTGGRYVLPQLNLQAGPLSASGTITVGASGELDGRITAALTARGTRSTLLLGGTLKDPQLRR